MRTPRNKYTEQKSHAKSRGIEWEFTFESWMDVWEKSGKWEQRGRKAHEYVMTRIGDVGPYSPSNVVIKTCADNTREFNSWYKITDETKLLHKKNNTGYKNPNSKLTDKQVIALRKDWDSGGFTKAELSRKYGIGYTQTSRLVKREQRTDI